MSSEQRETPGTADAAGGGLPAARRATAPGRPRGDGVAGRPLAERPLIRAGVYAWALAGLVVVLVIVGMVVRALSLVVIPLVLALFPAAVLAPPTEWLKRRGVRPALAALLVLLATIAALAGLVGLVVPAIASEVDNLAASLRQGVTSVQRFLQQGPFGFPPIDLQQLLRQAREQMTGGSSLASGAFGAALAVVETLAGLLFGLVGLFFYLKDGQRIAAWLRDLFPARARRDAEVIGVQVWHTVGGYIRGQLLIALVDAALIGVAIAVLGIPLAFPLTVLVFFGSLFPIVGAFVSGGVAVLVALATSGLVKALILLGVIFAVQELEGDVLAPWILGRATRLHPLATITALTAGAVLLGVLGAFLAVPITASVARAVAYLRGDAPA
jgi:predicted PurR-regulated permease PerM